MQCAMGIVKGGRGGNRVGRLFRLGGSKKRRQLSSEVAPAGTAPSLNLKEDIVEFAPEMTAWRHDFHMHPELGFEEFRTSQIVADKMESWGIRVTREIATTGVVGTLEGRSNVSGRSIGLRADMDCLPMEEENTFDHKSTIPGKMHGCGHDGHTTMLLGAARYLASTRDFDGTVHFIFQPAEEGLGGGRVMVEDERLFDRFPCDEVYGMHNWPELPFGEIAVMEGPLMAAEDSFEITVRGKGGHAAMPHQTLDPIYMGAQLVTALQSLVSRNTDPVDSAVLSVTEFHAGSAFNVIAESAVLRGTIRTFEKSTRDRMQESLRTVSEGLASSMGGSVDIWYDRGYPATVNDANATERAATVATSIFGEAGVKRKILPTMGAEDFSYMLEQRPGCYMFLGQAGGPSGCMVHNPKYDFNDKCLPVGSTVFAELVEQLMPEFLS
eukprot:g2646.t1